jgi:transposase
VITLARPNDPEYLRHAVQLLDAENRHLQRRIETLAKEVVELKGGAPEQLALELANLKELLASRERALLGDSSERRGGDTKPSKPAEPRGTGGGVREQPRLEVVEQEHELDAPDMMCPKCGGQLELMVGQYEESDEIDVVERRFITLRHRRRKYRCRCGSCIETAPAPVKLRPQNRYSINFAVEVEASKPTAPFAA